MGRCQRHSRGLVGLVGRRRRGRGDEDGEWLLVDVGAIFWRFRDGGFPQYLRWDVQMEEELNCAKSVVGLRKPFACNKMFWSCRLLTICTSDLRTCQDGISHPES